MLWMKILLKMAMVSLSVSLTISHLIHTRSVNCTALRLSPLCCLWKGAAIFPSASKKQGVHQGYNPDFISQESSTFIFYNLMLLHRWTAIIFYFGYKNTYVYLGVYIRNSSSFSFSVSRAMFNLGTLLPSLWHSFSILQPLMNFRKCQMCLENLCLIWDNSEFS